MQKKPYKQYKALTDATPDVHFVGRLATYKHYNMDQVVAQDWRSMLNWANVQAGILKKRAYLLERRSLLM